ncbi:hypothetical protein K2173_020611 [Erythroxylum novogranatense]|uniref:Uncharacterized protein n=1 Tax=Erythroxylum novogranatense TaxID=1862640 RepID=A0AAV8TJA6_9ROSI|nr:hypothetical protein K2173_020611 [Erythroxylum novogranatense]
MDDIGQGSCDELEWEQIKGGKLFITKNLREVKEDERCAKGLLQLSFGLPIWRRESAVIKERTKLEESKRKIEGEERARNGGRAFHLLPLYLLCMALL